MLAFHVVLMHKGNVRLHINNLKKFPNLVTRCVILNSETNAQFSVANDFVHIMIHFL